MDRRPFFLFVLFLVFLAVEVVDAVRRPVPRVDDDVMEIDAKESDEEEEDGDSKENEGEDQEENQWLDVEPQDLIMPEEVEDQKKKRASKEEQR